MTVQPTIETERLILRPFDLQDAVKVRELAGAREIYLTTEAVPHPYEEGMAEKWIASLAPAFYSGSGVTFAIQRKQDQEVLGAVGLIIVPQHKKANLGYWIGVPYWRNGYCSEASEAVVRYGFSQLSLHKISARHMNTNPASGRVMEKIGMRKEGELVDDVLKDGVFHTMVSYAILSSDQTP